jgi:hypothetical protein
VFQRSRLTDFFGTRSQLSAIGNELCAVGKWWALLQTERGPHQVGGYWLEIYARKGEGWKIRVSIFNITPSPRLSSLQPILAAADP